MSDHTPDPFLAQTGYDADAEIAEDFSDDVDFEFGDADDELAIEEERARER